MRSGVFSMAAQSSNRASLRQACSRPDCEHLRHTLAELLTPPEDVTDDLAHLRPVQRRMLALMLRRGGYVPMAALMAAASPQTGGEVMPESIHNALYRLRLSLRRAGVRIVIDNSPGNGWRARRVHEEGQT